MAKEGKGSSLSNQAMFAPFPLKVAWSGIYLIVPCSLYMNSGCAGQVRTDKWPLKHSMYNLLLDLLP